MTQKSSLKKIGFGDTDDSRRKQQNRVTLEEPMIRHDSKDTMSKRQSTYKGVFVGDHLQTEEPMAEGDHYKRLMKLNAFKQHLYADGEEGLSVRELLCIPRITKMIFASTMLFARFNMYNMLVQMPGAIDQFHERSLLLLTTQEIG